MNCGPKERPHFAELECEHCFAVQCFNTTNTRLVCPECERCWACLSTGMCAECRQHEKIKPKNKSQERRERSIIINHKGG
jgi:tRNA(Ile)-lysidine synthase TilS/MesJ